MLTKGHRSGMLLVLGFHFTHILLPVIIYIDTNVRRPHNGNAIKKSNNGNRIAKRVFDNFISLLISILMEVSLILVQLNNTNVNNCVNFV